MGGFFIDRSHAMEPHAWNFHIINAGIESINPNPLPVSQGETVTTISLPRDIFTTSLA